MGGNWNGESLMTDYNSDTMNFFSTFVVCLVILKWISLIVVAAIIAKLVTIILRWITVIKQCSLIPSPRTRPILGHIWDLLVPPKGKANTTIFHSWICTILKESV